MKHDEGVAPVGSCGVSHRYIASESGVKRGHGDLSDGGSLSSIIWTALTWPTAMAGERRHEIRPVSLVHMVARLLTALVR